MRLFHLLDEAALEEAASQGAYTPPSLKNEGFVHLSTEAQWRGTAKRFFSGRTDLVLLELELEGHDVRFEAADGDSFPHLYEALPLGAIVAVHRVAPDPTGAFVITGTETR